ncbi:MAG: GNAT family N-acetyltransferase [Chloroflexi bacterium]|nr:GNAT family N-acetyltransferase [Chloroflexota bacterium]
MRVPGTKVVLREKRLSDALQDYQWRTDKELARLDAATPLAMSFADYHAFCMEDLQFPDPLRRRFAIETLDGIHIGNCTYYDVDERRGQCQVGIMIGDKSYWDQGYGTDAMTTLVDHIFRTTKFERVYLETLDWNIRAHLSFQKVGFFPCGREQRPPYTFIVMEMFRHQWETAGGAAAARQAAPARRTSSPGG